ncbi:MAG: hypothetical protein Rhims3KO_19260 [Hyphomicrobiales bacterium]
MPEASPLLFDWQLCGQSDQTLSWIKGLKRAESGSLLRFERRTGLRLLLAVAGLSLPLNYVVSFAAAAYAIVALSC